MRPCLLLLCCLLLCGTAFAQKQFRYAGYVQMPNNPLVSYYVELQINGSNVSGYSITGYQDGNRLKAAVTGYFTSQSDLYIRETASLDGRDLRQMTYCYFSAHLKLTVMMNGRKRWNGAFESRQADGSPCPASLGEGGVMTIMDNAPPLEDVKPKPNIARVEVPKPQPIRVKADTPKRTPPPPPVAHKPKDTLKPPPPVVQKPKALPKPVTTIIQPPAAPPPAPDTCQRTYQWSSDDFVFDIWDGWTIDGDVVSLSMSGRSLLQHVKLSETKQRFSMPLTRGLNVLYIYLHEEGFDPPNTPNLTLHDGSQTYELSVSGNNGEVARICIWRK